MTRKWTNAIGWGTGDIGTERVESVDLTGLWLAPPGDWDDDRAKAPLCPECREELELVSSEGIGGFYVVCSCEEPPGWVIKPEEDSEKK